MFKMLFSSLANKLKVTFVETWNDHCSYAHNLCSCGHNALEIIFRLEWDSKPITSMTPVQCSTNYVTKPTGGWLCWDCNINTSSHRWWVMDRSEYMKDLKFVLQRKKDVKADFQSLLHTLVSLFMFFVLCHVRHYKM